MSGKLFGQALFGYKKSDVNYYIEKLDSEFSAHLQETLLLNMISFRLTAKWSLRSLKMHKNLLTI